AATPRWNRSACSWRGTISGGLFGRILDHAQERVDDVGIELPAALTVDLSDRVRDGPRRFVGALLRQGVEYVGHRDDPPRERDVGPAHAGVALAVPPLVVRKRDLLRQAQQRKLAAGQDPRADDGVRLDDL